METDTSIVAIGGPEDKHWGTLTGQALESLLNSLLSKDGARVRNARVFSIEGLYVNDEIKEAKAKIDEAMMWTLQGWALLPTADMFAHKQAILRLRYHTLLAEKSAISIHKFIEKDLADLLEINIDKDERTKALEKCKEAAMMKLKGKNYKIFSKAHNKIRKRDEDEEEEERPEPEQEEELTETMQTKDELQAACQREQAALPDWASFDPDPTAWMELLTECGIDKLAQQSLFLLGQMSPQGWEEANTLLGKLIRNKDGQEWLENPSKFIHKCCCNARTKLQQGSIKKVKTEQSNQNDKWSRDYQNSRGSWEDDKWTHDRKWNAWTDDKKWSRDQQGGRSSTNWSSSWNSKSQVISGALAPKRSKSRSPS